MHRSVFLQSMHFARLGLAALKPAQRLRYRHLIDENLILPQWCFRYPVAGLNHARFRCALSGLHTGRFGKKLADANRVGRVIRALVNYFQDIIRAQNTCRHLHTTRPPAVWQWHLTAGKRDLVARNSNRLEDDTADAALGLLIQIGKVITRETGLRDSR